MLAAVYANPDDIATRQVYADALTDLGDPRGEFIALQCNGSDPARERDLLESHREHWLGALAPLLHIKGSEFANGFLATARVRAMERAAIGHPLWSTVVQVDFVRGGEAASALVMSPQMRSLRGVSGLDAAALGTLCSDGDALAIREIEAHAPAIAPADDGSWRIDTAVAATIANARGLPELRRLVIAAHAPLYRPRHMRWLISSPLAGRLEQLEIRGIGELQHWGELLPYAHHALGELVIRDARGRAHFRRGNDGKLSELELDVRGIHASLRRDPAQRIAQLPPGLLTTVTITQ